MPWKREFSLLITLSHSPLVLDSVPVALLQWVEVNFNSDYRRKKGNESKYPLFYLIVIVYVLVNAVI